MSRMRTSCASFSWARPAIRRACSIGVRGSSSPFLLATSVATRTGRAPRLRGRRPRGTSSSTGSPRATRSRTCARRDGRRARARTRRRGRRSAPGRAADSPERVPTASRTQRSTSSGSFQPGKSAPSSAPTTKYASPKRPPRTASTVNGLSSSSTSAGSSANAARARREALLRRRDRPAVAGLRRDQHDEPVDRKRRRAPRAPARRGRCAAGRRCRRGSPVVTAIRAPRRRPRPRRRSSRRPGGAPRRSSSSPGGRPTTRKPRSVRRIRNRRRGSGFGR